MPRRKKQSSEAAVLDGLRGEVSVAELCRREGIAANLYYRWSKDFLEAGKKQLSGDTVREATSTEVKDLRAENSELLAHSQHSGVSFSIGETGVDAQARRLDTVGVGVPFLAVPTKQLRRRAGPGPAA